MNTFEQLKKQAQKKQAQEKADKEKAAYDLEMRRADNLGKAVANALQSISEVEEVSLEDLQDYGRVTGEDWYLNPDDQPSRFNFAINLPSHLIIDIWINLREMQYDHENYNQLDWFVDRHGDYRSEHKYLGDALVAAEAGYLAQQEAIEQAKFEEENLELEEENQHPHTLADQARIMYIEGDLETARTLALLSIAQTLEKMRQNGIFTVPY